MIIFFWIWLIAFLAQVYYWLIPLGRKQVPGNTSPEVSIVVCVNRDATKLHRLLTSLFDQTYLKYEVVVVNDGPHPEISACLDNFLHQKNLRVINFDTSTKTIPGKKGPLTAGIHAAKHDWILLTDGDCVTERGWIKSMIEHMEEGKKILLGYAPFTEAKGLLNKIQRFDSIIVALQYLGAALRGKPYMGVGRNLLYHRDLFRANDGFSKHIDIASGDDDLFIQEVSNAQNTSTCLDPASFVHSEAPSTWKDWVHQKRRHLSASSRYKSGVKFRNALFGASWWITWLGLPVLMFVAFGFCIKGLVAIIILWVLFGRVAFALRQQGLIGLFPILAIVYCFLLCTFAVLMVRHAPSTWTKS